MQPRVFYEGFPKKVLYVHDVKSAQGAAIWKGVFIADITDPAAPRITMAERGILVSEGKNLLHLHLINGASHETVANEPDKYQISTFQETDIPIALPESSVATDQPPSVIGEVPTGSLLQLARTRKNPAAARWYWIEFHRRFALPTACLVLGLEGVPLGMSAKNGGITTVLVLTGSLGVPYSFVSLFRTTLERQ